MPDEAKKELTQSVRDRLARNKTQSSEVEEFGAIRIYTSETFSMKAGELAAVIESNPEHPVAQAYRRAASMLPAEQELAVERIDLEALLDDRIVHITESTSTTDLEGVVVPSKERKKILGEKRKRETTPANPSAPTTEPTNRPVLRPKS